MISPRVKKLAILGLGSSVGTPPEGKDGYVMSANPFKHLALKFSPIHVTLSLLPLQVLNQKC